MLADRQICAIPTTGGGDTSRRTHRRAPRRRERNGGVSIAVARLVPTHDRVLDRCDAGRPGCCYRPERAAGQHGRRGCSLGEAVISAASGARQLTTASGQTRSRRARPTGPSESRQSPNAGLAQWRAQSPICIGNSGATCLRCAGSRAAALGARVHCRLTPIAAVSSRLLQRRRCGSVSASPDSGESWPLQALRRPRSGRQLLSRGFDRAARVDRRDRLVATAIARREGDET